MWTNLKVFIESVTRLFVLPFAFWACGILAPQTGIEPAPPVLEDEILRTGPLGKPHLETLISELLWLTVRSLTAHLRGHLRKESLPRHHILSTVTVFFIFF